MKQIKQYKSEIEYERANAKIYGTNASKKVEVHASKDFDIEV